MAKMYFRYSAMGGGKTAHLIQVVDNYKRVNRTCLVLKPGIDTKGGNKVVSRSGREIKVDYTIPEDMNILEDNIYNVLLNSDCIVVDEAQFLTEEQVDQLYEFTKVADVPVICYGLRTRVNGKTFRGSGPLLGIADDIEEIKSICECGNKASFQVRYINNELDMGDEEVVIDIPENHVEYKSVCGACFYKLKNIYRNKGHARIKK